MVKVAIYIRISDKKQEEGLSKEFQEKILTGECKKNGWEIYKTYTETHSATRGKRKIYQECLKDAQENRFDVVLVTRFDRIFRSVVEGILTIVDWNKNKIDLICLGIGSKKIDTTTTEGKMLFYVSLLFAEIEGDIKRDRVVPIQRDKVSKGKIITRSPFGYNLIGKGSGNARWIINKKQAEVIREIFNGFVEGVTIRMLCDEYSMPPSKIKYILKNQSYLGKIKYAGEWFKGNHTAIIDKDAFDKANSKINKI